LFSKKTSLYLTSYLHVLTFNNFPHVQKECEEVKLLYGDPGERRLVVKHCKYGLHYIFKVSVGGLAEKLNKQGGQV